MHLSFPAAPAALPQHPDAGAGAEAAAPGGGRQRARPGADGRARAVPPAGAVARARAARAWWRGQRELLQDEIPLRVSASTYRSYEFINGRFNNIVHSNSKYLFKSAIYIYPKQ